MPNILDIFKVFASQVVIFTAIQDYHRMGAAGQVMSWFKLVQV